LVKTDYIIPELTEGEGSPGEYRPGKVILTFKALEAGNAAVVLQYTRPWENNMASVAETYIVSVIVSP
jgi:predicted secreted protein